MKRVFLLSIIMIYLFYMLLGTAIFSMGAEPVLSKNTERFKQISIAIDSKK